MAEIIKGTWVQIVYMDWVTVPMERSNNLFHMPVWTYGPFSTSSFMLSDGRGISDKQMGRKDKFLGGIYLRCSNVWRGMPIPKTGGVLVQWHTEKLSSESKLLFQKALKERVTHFLKGEVLSAKSSKQASFTKISRSLKPCPNKRNRNWVPFNLKLFRADPFFCSIQQIEAGSCSEKNSETTDMIGNFVFFFLIS